MCTMRSAVETPVIDDDDAICFRHDGSAHLRCGGIGFDRLSVDEVRITLRIVSQPNYIRVVRYRDWYILTNGYHRALSMALSGVDRILCVVAEDASAEELLRKNNFLDLDVAERFLPRLEDYVDGRYARTIVVRKQKTLFTLRPQIHVTTVFNRD
jgi:hypothetical protein